MKSRGILISIESLLFKHNPYSVKIANLKIFRGSEKCEFSHEGKIA